MCDAVIIGAGPAGCVAGMLLAQAGKRVTIIEQHRFPRDKVCGECISALGVEVLSRCGVLGRVLAAGAVRMGRFVVHAPDGACSAAELPAAMLGLSRGALDAALLAAAREAGAEVMQPARAEGIADAGVAVRDLGRNRVEVVRGRVVIVADGRSALMGNKPETTGDLGIKAHFEGVDGARDAVQLFGVQAKACTPNGAAGCYGGIAPIAGGLFNLAFSVPAEWVKRTGGVEAAFEAMVAGNAALARQLRRARRVSEWLAAPLPRYGVRGDWPAGVIPVGNAAAAIEPIGGEGMGLAMRSAELAAEAVLAGHPADWLQREYRQLWRTRAWACRAAAICVSSPALCGIAVEAMGSWDALRAVVVGWMGKRG